MKELTERSNDRPKYQTAELGTGLQKVALCAIAVVSIGNLFVNSAYAHGVGGCLAGCPVGGGTGFRGIVTNDSTVLFLIETLTTVGMIAFFGSIAFGIFVLIKNRARKVVC